MAKRRPILIRCPHYQKLVPGAYDCDESGEFLCAADGSFILSRAHCGHNAGRCTQTLCVMHRHNTGGSKSWFPEGIVVPTGPRKGKGARANRPPRRRKAGPGGRDMDLLC
ncbi:MAG: hypothetical protein J7M14_02020 [Planctomycetes bacterium]|nr:hypothetical protein [Planctomycetota bacterium]